jgi:molybdate transport system permease protein
MLISIADWKIVGFTLCTAAIAVSCDLIPGILLAWVLARKSWPGKTVVETIASLPLVLPPVAVGLLLLELLGRRGLVGRWLHQWGIDVAFTWKAVVIAMAVMSFPFIVRSARVAFDAVNPRLEHVASTLGASPLRVAFTITLPLAARGIMAGFIIAFTRSLGEFGATILVAGNIPGYTTTISTSIYNRIMLGRDNEAIAMILISILFAFSLNLAGEFLVRVRPS